FSTHAQRFNGSFFRRSIYSGQPTSEMDHAWSHFTKAGSEDAQKSTAYPLDTAVKMKDTDNQGYMASLEIFHQIHCLDMIRKFVHFDYYKKHDEKWAKGQLLVQHADHCIDMLREVLNCRSDTGLVMYHWVKGYEDPIPDFSTVHTCRDPEEALHWTKARAVQLTQGILRGGQEPNLTKIF
ncbi:hypothetical protein B0O99DRAFT_517225, partial [Bisporella sp. PMI_857]